MHSLMGNKDNSAGQNRLKFVSETFKYYDVDTNGDLMLVKDPTAWRLLTRIQITVLSSLNMES